MWDDLLNKYLFLWTVLIIKKTFKCGTITIEFFFASGYAFDSYRFFLSIFLRIGFASRGGAQDDDQWRVIAGGQSLITEKSISSRVREFSIRVPPYHIWTYGSRMLEIKHRTGMILRKTATQLQIEIKPLSK